MNNFFSTKPFMESCGIAIVRITVGIFLIYHGHEIFDPAKMKEFANWDQFKYASSPLFMPYLGKGAELLGGLFLTAGLFTRFACIVIIGTMLYISFFVGSGKIWFEDQYPFLFALLALVFIFTGPGSLALDKIIFDRKP